MSNKWHTGLTPAAREVMKKLGRFRTQDIVDGLGSMIQTYKDRRRIKKAIYDCRKRGEITRTERGLYEYVGKMKPPELQEKMWKVLRAKRSVEKEDLQELAGTSESYAYEWLQMLARNGVVRHLDNGRWQMIYDPVEMPLNKEKTQRLRGRRLKNKEAAIAALAKAMQAIEEAKTAISGLKE